MIVCAGQPRGRVLLICCVVGSKNLKKGCVATDNQIAQ
jgi:hypothetical protein